MNPRSEYDFRPVREHDARDNLLRAGFRWHETNYDAMMPAVAIATFSGVAVVMLVALAAGLSRPVDALPQIVMVLVGISVAAIMIALRFFKPLREVVIERDGNIALPHGLPEKSSARRMLAHHNQVVSIEARSRQSLGFSVVMILREGSTTTLSRHLTESEALMVAVQLSTALSEMRASIADGLRVDDMPQERSDDGRERVSPPVAY